MSTQPLSPAINLLQLIHCKLGTDPEGRFREIIESGLLHDLLDTPIDLNEIDRDAFRKSLGLSKIEWDIIHLDTDLSPTALELVQSVNWTTKCPWEDAPQNNVGRKGKHRMRFLPFSGGHIPDVMGKHFRNKGTSPADFRETIAGALTVKSMGCFICPIPIIRGEETFYYAVIRTSRNLHLVATRFFGFHQNSGFVSIKTAEVDNLILVHRHQVFLATM